MEILTIDEVIEHCERQVRQFNKVADERDAEFLNSNFGKIFMEHKLTAEWLKELKEYRDAEEQVFKVTGADLASMIGEYMHYYNLKIEGRLLELPCKFGDTVYEANLRHEYVIKRTVAAIMIRNNSIWVRNGCGDSFEYGVEVFLTREEAKAELERMGVSV